MCILVIIQRIVLPVAYKSHYYVDCCVSFSSDYLKSKLESKNRLPIKQLIFLNLQLNTMLIFYKIFS